MVTNLYIKKNGKIKYVKKREKKMKERKGKKKDKIKAGWVLWKKNGGRSNGYLRVSKVV